MMARFLIVLLAGFLGLSARCASHAPTQTDTEAGRAALQMTGDILDFGARPSGSAALENVRGWILQQVERQGLSLVTDAFTVRTPIGNVEMKNLSFTIPGRVRNERVLLMAHYESKRILEFEFLGANDSAASVALLLALIPSIQNRRFGFDTQIVFLDGEEAFVSWSEEDSLYGSRHLAETLRQDASIKAALVVDMVADRDLELVNDVHSDADLRNKMRSILREWGWADLMATTPIRVEDDHLPLARVGIPTLLIMDFTFGGSQTPGTYWHTPQDTLDKCSSASLSVVGELVLELLARLSPTA